MQDHRLGYPAVLAALHDHEPRRSFYTPSRGRRSAEEDSERAELDGALTSDLQAPPSVSRYSEPHYIPEGWSQLQWHSPSGSGPVVKRQPAGAEALMELWAGGSERDGVFDDYSGPDAAPQEWQDGAPPCGGWYMASEGGFHNLCSHWNGHLWSPSVGITTDGRISVGDPSQAVQQRRCDDESSRVKWRGQRLVGDQWPEPEMSLSTLESICDKWQSDNAHIDRKELCAISDAIARKYGAEAPCGIPADKRAAFAAELQATVLTEDVPTAEECRLAYEEAPMGDGDRPDLRILRDYVPRASDIGDIAAAQLVPANFRAEFIRRLRAL